MTGVFSSGLAKLTVPYVRISCLVNRIFIVVPSYVRHRHHMANDVEFVNLHKFHWESSLVVKTLILTIVILLNYPEESRQSELRQAQSEITK